MSRLYLLLLAVIVAALMLGMAIAEHPGYVLFAYKGFRFESSLWAFLGLLLLFWGLIWGLRLVLGLITASGGVVNPWSRRNYARRVRLAARRGQRDLAEGRWTEALRHLRRAAAGDQHPLVHYLGAARAANELGDYAESDSLLREAREREPQADIAIGLTQARLQIARGQYQEALACVKKLHDEHPQHPYVLRLMQRLYVQLQDWPALCLLLPELRKRKALPGGQLDELERLAWSAALAQSAPNEPQDTQTIRESLSKRWRQLPTSLREDADLVHGYAARLRDLGAEEEAEAVLRTALERRYEERLVYLYGQVRGSDPARQLQLAEGWLKTRPSDPLLLLTLGRLCLFNQLWGKAREYLEASLSFARKPETCAELARLLAQLGETERSNRLFQEGLQLLNPGSPALPQPVAR